MKEIEREVRRLEEAVRTPEPRQFVVPGFGTFDSPQEAIKAPGWGDLVEEMRQELCPGDREMVRRLTQQQQETESQV